MSRGASRHAPPRATAVKPKDTHGASTSKQRIGDRFDSYISHHRASFGATVFRLKRNIGQTILTSFVVAIALALPAMLMVALSNVQSVGEQWDTEPKLTLYLHSRAKQAGIDSLLAELATDKRIESAKYISPDDALAEFEAISGFGAALSGLKNNPLPAAIELSLERSYQEPAVQAQLAAELQQKTIVEEASLDLQWVQRFLSLTELARRAVMCLAILLALGALLAIGNTVKLIIESRKDEIIVIKLVGGTNGFVRRPLLYTGGAYGFLGGVLAWIIVSLILFLISGSVESIAQSYQSQFDLQGLGFVQTLQLIGVGTALGWLGAILAVGRHLSEIEPT